MRHWFVIALAGLITVGWSADAEAGKKKKGDTTEQADAEGIELVDTGLAQVDEFFGKAKAPVDTVTNTRVSLNKVNTDLNAALSLTVGTPLADAVADLKGKAGGKIKVAMDGAMPSLSVDDAAPEDVKSAVSALNGALGELGTVSAGLKELPTQLAGLIQEGQQFTDPGTLKGMASNPVAATKAVPKVMKNLKALGQAKDEAEELVKSITVLKKTLSTLNS